MDEFGLPKPRLFQVFVRKGEDEGYRKFTGTLDQCTVFMFGVACGILATTPFTVINSSMDDSNPENYRITTHNKVLKYSEKYTIWMEQEPVEL